MTNSAWTQLQEHVRDRHILVFGVGLQGGGVGAANTLVRAGAIVRATDTKSENELRDSLTKLHPGITGTYGHNTEEDIEWAEIIIKNPAVPYDHPLLQKAHSLGKTVTTETALALSIVRDRAIGITGTRGKTTTSTLIHRVLQEAGRDIVLCGNIPEQPTLAALEHASDETWFVVEISSFHVEGLLIKKTSPHIAVVTNAFPDHLNRYTNLETYARVKAALFAFQKPGDHAFWGTQHDWTELFEANIQPGVERHPVTESMVHAAEQLGSPLPGRHNLENIALAVEVAKSLDIPLESIQKTIANFRGVAHRLEPVSDRLGITYINDTTSTTPIALEKALEAQNEPFILICGGTTKHLPFTPNLVTHLHSDPQAIVFLQGSGTSELLATLGSLERPHAVTATLQESVEQAERFCQELLAKRIVFSPGFSSFELFRNEFDRGDQFTALARRAV